MEDSLRGEQEEDQDGREVVFRSSITLETE